MSPGDTEGTHSYERAVSKLPENLIYNWVSLKILWDLAAAAIDLKRLRVFNKCSIARDKWFLPFLKGKKGKELPGVGTSDLNTKIH